MEAKELLKPRFEVIENFPNSKHRIGLVLTNTITNYFTYEIEDKKFITKIEDIEKYPHLFRKLNWWEYRKESEMPKKLKSMASKDNPDFDIEKEEVFHILKWDMNGMMGFLNIEKREVCDLELWGEGYGYIPVD